MDWPLQDTSKVFIVLPSVIYGLVAGELVEQGTQNLYSTMIQFAQMALDQGRSGIVGADLKYLVRRGHSTRY